MNKNGNFCFCFPSYQNVGIHNTDTHVQEVEILKNTDDLAAATNAAPAHGYEFTDVAFKQRTDVMASSDRQRFFPTEQDEDDQDASNDNSETAADSTSESTTQTSFTLAELQQFTYLLPTVYIFWHDL